MITKLLVAWLVITVAAVSFLILDKKDFPEVTVGDLLVTVIFWPMLLIIALGMLIEKIMSKNIRKED